MKRKCYIAGCDEPAGRAIFAPHEDDDRGLIEIPCCRKHFNRAGDGSNLPGTLPEYHENPIYKAPLEGMNPLHDRNTST